MLQEKPEGAVNEAVEQAEELFRQRENGYKEEVKMVNVIVLVIFNRNK